MNIFKERIIGAITVMSNNDLEKLWDILKTQFSNSWDNIEEIEPDEIDIKMLNEIENNPDCKVFVSENDALKQLGITKNDLISQIGRAHV